MTSRRTSTERARAIETICWAAGRSAFTFVRGEIDSCPSRASRAVESAVHPIEVEQRPAARLVREEDALGHREVADQVELLVDRRDAARQRCRRVPDRERLALEQDLAAGGLVHAGDALDQRRLAGSVGAEQAVHLALEDVEADPLQRLDAGELLHEVAHLEDLGHATTSPRRLRCAIRRPASIRSGLPPHTGSSCSTDRAPSKPPS